MKEAQFVALSEDDHTHPIAAKFLQKVWPKRV